MADRELFYVDMWDSMVIVTDYSVVVVGGHQSVVAGQ